MLFFQSHIGKILPFANLQAIKFKIAHIESVWFDFCELIFIHYYFVTFLSSIFSIQNAACTTLDVAVIFSIHWIIGSKFLLKEVYKWKMNRKITVAGAPLSVIQPNGGVCWVRYARKIIGTDWHSIWLTQMTFQTWIRLQVSTLCEPYMCRHHTPNIVIESLRWFVKQKVRFSMSRSSLLLLFQSTYFNLTAFGSFESFCCFVSFGIVSRWLSFRSENYFDPFSSIH